MTSQQSLNQAINMTSSSTTTTTTDDPRSHSATTTAAQNLDRISSSSHDNGQTQVQTQTQQQQAQTQSQLTTDYYPHKVDGSGGPAATAPFLQDFSLVAEAAKRAEMSVIMRDMEGISL